MTIGYSKLTEKQVLEIIGLRKQGLNYTEIARKFGVHRQTISNMQWENSFFYYRYKM